MNILTFMTGNFNGIGLLQVINVTDPACPVLNICARMSIMLIILVIRRVLC